MKYTNPMFSRILGEHAAGQLVRGGSWYWGGSKKHSYPCGCAIQAAFNCGNLNETADKHYKAAILFDEGYEPDMTPEVLLTLLERGNEMTDKKPKKELSKHAK